MRLLAGWTGLAFYLVGLHLALSGCGASSPVSNSTKGKGEDTLRGELVLYPRATEIGVIARRTFHDSSGRKVREILYARKLEKTTAVGDTSAWYQAPAGEEGLREQEHIEYKYNADGLLWREERRDPGGTLRRILDHVDDTGKAAYIWRRPDGSREYEILRHSGSQKLHIYYNDTGTEITGFTGLTVPGIDLTRGWGEATGGLVCGIGVNRSLGPLTGTEISVSLANKSNREFKVFSTLGLPQISVELYDLQGNSVPPDEARRQARVERHASMNPGADENTEVLSPGESRQVQTIELDDFYADLHEGEYEVIVKLRASAVLHDLVSNTLSIGIVAKPSKGAPVPTNEVPVQHR